MIIVVIIQISPFSRCPAIPDEPQFIICQEIPTASDEAAAAGETIHPTPTSSFSLPDPAARTSIPSSTLRPDLLANLQVGIW